jgi:glycosyltransferase involved in cell wall biosynthesis
MIVRNEAHCIERCLTSVKNLIDCWSIVDTGSTDGTQQKIREIMKEMPGVLHEGKWIDFAHNRTESIELARSSGADYALVMDADDVLELPIGYNLPKLEANSYRFRIEYGKTAYYRTQLFKLNLPFRYVGVLHEFLHCDGLFLFDDPILEGPIYRCFPEGHRSADPNKFLKDVETLKKGIVHDPINSPRYTFYLAQSYRDAGKIEKALRAFERRTRMIGWDEETWMAHHEAARLQEWLNYPEQSVVTGYLRSWEVRPQRAEPLYELARYYRTKKNRPAVGYVYAVASMTLPVPPDRLMLDTEIYAWRRKYEYAITSWYAGKQVESHQAHLELLADPQVEAPERAALQNNMSLFK